jgi:hypothetical protein
MTIIYSMLFGCVPRGTQPPLNVIDEATDAYSHHRWQAGQRRQCHKLPSLRLITANWGGDTKTLQGISRHAGAFTIQSAALCVHAPQECQSVTAFDRAILGQITPSFDPARGTSQTGLLLG